jgi:hypothetical protein
MINQEREKMPDTELAKEIEQAVDEFTTPVQDGEAKNEEKPSGTAAEPSGDEKGAGPAFAGDTGGAVEEATEGTGEEASEQPSEGQPGPEEEITYVSDEMLARAIGAGVSLADALSFPDEQSLERVISAVEKTRKPVEEKKDGEIKQDDLFSALPKLDPESYDPEVLAYFDALTGIIKKQQEQIQASHARHDEIQQSAQNYQAQEIENWFDNQIKELGEEYSDALGKSKYRALDRGSSQYANREAIANNMSILLSGYRAQGKPIPPREDIFDMAVGIVFADKIEEIESGKLSGDLEARASQHIQRAGGRKAVGQKTPRDEAAEALKEKFGI